MKQAGDIATITSRYSVNMKLVKITEFNFRSQLRQGYFREGVVNRNTQERGQSLTYIITLSTSTVQSLSHIAKCCGR